MPILLCFEPFSSTSWPSSLKSFSTSSFHLNLGLLFFSLLAYFQRFFLNNSSLVHSDHVSQLFHPFPFISATKSGALYSSLNSSFLLILRTPYSVTGPYTFLRIFLSHIFSLVLSFFVMDYASPPNITIGWNIVLYILIPPDDTWVIMKHQWNDIDRRTLKDSEKYLSQCHFVHISLTD
jgi:hypothetical protein